MEDFVTAIMPVVNELLTTIVILIFGYIGTKLKAIKDKQINTAEKEMVVQHTVKYVEQVYKDVHGQEKFDACLAKVDEILKEKGIPFGQEEIKVLIESAVNSMNYAAKVKD